MIKEFRTFLLQTNALALAVGVIIGAGIGKLVGSLVSDILMPVVGVFMPGGSWRDLKLVLSRNADGTAANAMTYGAFLGAVIDFVIVAAAVFLLTKLFIKPAAAAPAAETRTCPACLEVIPRAAKRCRACTTALDDSQSATSAAGSAYPALTGAP